MKKKFLMKIIVFIMVFSMVVNTTFSFAAIERNYFNKDERRINTTTSLIADSIISKYSRRDNSRIFRFNNRNRSTKIEEPEKALAEALTTISKLPMFKEYFGNADVSEERLATIIRESLKDVDLSDPETFKTLIKQLTVAIMKTTDLTNGMVTEDDLNKMMEEMTSGKYYYPDATDEVTYTSIQDIARLSNYGSISPEVEGKPIAIGKVYIHGEDIDEKYGEKGKEVYMVALNGTGFVEGQQYGLVADLLSGMEMDSQYLQYALKAILENIPKDSDLIIVGMSLGGMIAQQVMVQDCILENYNIEYVTIIGSPALCVNERKTQFEKYNKYPIINRVIDQQDLIPYASIDYLTGEDYFYNNTSIPKDGVVLENLFVNNSNYHYKTGIGHHFLGYLADEVWKNYDPLGNERLINTITLKHSDFEYYDSPSYTNGTLSMFE